MKKILFLTFFLIGTFSLNAQITVLTKLDSLYDDYYDEYFNGNLPTAERKGYKLLRASTLVVEMLQAQGTGDATTATAALSAYNTMLGTSLSLPTYNFDETAQTYLSIDSINVGGHGYVDSLISWAGVLAAIAANPAIDEDAVADQIEDSLDLEVVRIRGEIEDSLDAEIVKIRDEIHDSIAGLSLAVDSTWESTVTDSIYLNNATNDAYFIGDASYGIRVNETGDAGDYGFRTTGILGINSGAAQVYFNAAGAYNDPPFVPNNSDTDNGFTYVSTNKVGVTAGGDSAITFSQAVTTVRTRLLVVSALESSVDSVSFYSPTRIYDTMYYAKADTATDDTLGFWLKNGWVYTTHLSEPSGWGLTYKLEPLFIKMIKGYIKGEFEWPFISQNKIKKPRLLNKLQPNYIQQLQASNEFLYRYIFRTQFILVLGFVLLFWYFKKSRNA
jgi:hypothetical protein